MDFGFPALATTKSFANLDAATKALTGLESPGPSPMGLTRTLNAGPGPSVLGPERSPLSTPYSLFRTLNSDDVFFKQSSETSHEQTRCAPSRSLSESSNDTEAPPTLSSRMMPMSSTTMLGRRSSPMMRVGKLPVHSGSMSSTDSSIYRAPKVARKDTQAPAQAQAAVQAQQPVLAAQAPAQHVAPATAPTANHKTPAITASHPHHSSNHHPPPSNSGKPHRAANKRTRHSSAASQSSHGESGAHNDLMSSNASLANSVKNEWTDGEPIYYKDEDRKMKHRLIDRARRRREKSSIEELKGLVTLQPRQRPDKATVVASAVRTIRDLNARITSLERRVRNANKGGGPNNQRLHSSAGSGRDEGGDRDGDRDSSSNTSPNSHDDDSSPSSSHKAAKDGAGEKRASPPPTTTALSSMLLGLASAGVASAVIDLRTATISTVCSRFLSVSGFTRAQVLGKRFSELPLSGRHLSGTPDCEEPSQDQVKQGIKLLLNGGSFKMLTRHACIRKGMAVEAVSTMFLLRDDDNRPYAVLAISTPDSRRAVAFPDLAAFSNKDCDFFVKLSEELNPSPNEPARSVSSASASSPYSNVSNSPPLSQSPSDSPPGPVPVGSPEQSYDPETQSSVLPSALAGNAVPSPLLQADALATSFSPFMYPGAHQYAPNSLEWVG